MMKNTKWYMLVIVLLLGAFVLVACGGGTQEAAPTQAPAPTEEAAPEPTDEPAPEPTEEPAEEPTPEPVAEEPVELMSDTSKSIATLLSENSDFSTLVAAITAAGIEEPGPDADPVTIFAPTNAAFAAVDPALMERFMADPSGELTRVLQYHIVNGAQLAEAVTADEDGRLDTLAGERIDLANFGLVATDIEGSNGVIHVIDTVQVPPTITNSIRAEELTAEGVPVIRVWADDLRLEALEVVESAFEEEYEVELLLEEVAFGDIRRLLQIAGPAGEGPDIIVGAFDWVGELVANGSLSPVDAGDLVEQFTPASINAFTYDGELYGLPYATENVAFFINTDLVPECPATWDEVYQISTELHTADAAQYGFVRQGGDPYHFYPIQTSFGGYIFGRDENGNYDPTQVGFGDEGSIAAGEWLERMVAEGLQPANVTGDILQGMFEDGSAAMQITGPWNYQRTADSGIPFAICPIPTGTVEGKPFMGSQGFMISAFSENPQIAQFFLTDFVATEEVQQAIFNNGERPSAFLPVLNATEEQWLADFGAAGLNADPMPAIPEMGSVWGAADGALVLIHNGDPAVNAFTTAQEQIITAIESN